MFSCVERLSDPHGESIQTYGVDDVMKFSILEISNDDISGTGRPINFVFDSVRVFGDGESNGPTFGCTKSKMAAGRHLGKFRMTISLE